MGVFVIIAGLHTVLMHIEAVHGIRRSTMSTYGAQKAAGRLIVCVDGKKS